MPRDSCGSTKRTPVGRADRFRTAIGPAESTGSNRVDQIESHWPGPETPVRPSLTGRVNRVDGAQRDRSFGVSVIGATAVPSRMELEPERTAVVVVDMQNDFCHPDGALYAPGSEGAIEPITALLDRAHEAGVKTVFTRDVHPPEQFEDARYYDEFEQWGEHVVEGTWGAEVVEDLQVGAADTVVEKHTYDAFQRTELDGWLTARNVRDLLFCGTLANVCVLHTAGSAGLRDYRPILLEDCIGAIEDEHHEYALDHAEWLFGEVHTSDEVSFV